MDRFRIDTHGDFQKLYRKYYKALMLYALKMTHDEETAEDIVQNAFLKLWEKRIDMENEAMVRSFLYLSVRQRSIDRFRRTQVEDKYRKYVLGASDGVEKEWDDEEIFSNELYRRLFKAIDELPPRQREIFLAYMEGKSNADIAEAMHIKVDTIRVQKKRALKTLRGKISREELILLLLLTI